MQRSIRTAFLLALVALVGCGGMGPGQKEAKFVQSVAVVPVRTTNVVRTIGLIGTVQGEQQAYAMSKIMGKVTEIARAEGSFVSEGDPIVYVVNDIPGMDYKPGPVRAPVAGIVGKVHVEVGQFVAQGTPVAVVSNYSRRVKVKAGISDQDLRFVKKGANATVSVTAYPDTTFSGTVTGVTPVVDQMSRTATVEVAVVNSSRKLVPGMACGVMLELERREDVLALPLTALFTNGFSKIAVLDGNVARFREIEIGLRGDRLAEIVSGLNGDEKVITTGKERIEDGGEVRAVEDDQQ